MSDNSPIRRRWRAITPWIGLLLTAAALASGCQQSTPLEEHWESFYIAGRKVGWGHTTVRRLTEDQQQLRSIESVNHLAVERLGQPIEQEVRTKSIETPGGKLVRFEAEVVSGNKPLRTTGRVAGDQLIVEMPGAPMAKIPWSESNGGFTAMEQSLERSPMKSGEQRSIQVLMPLVNQLTTVELTAGDTESVKLFDGERKLLRIDTVTKLPDGQSIDTALWADEHGTVFKSRVEAMQQESFRTTREAALAPGKGGALDLLTTSQVPLDRPLPQGHRGRQARYLIEITGKDAAKVFPASVSQHVESKGPQQAELTVRAVHSASDVAEADQAAAPKADALAANHFIESDDASIKKLATDAAPKGGSSWQTAKALEGYVHKSIHNVNFSQAFATAAETARSHQGDCTEHAVLLAALLRARKIPARVAIGMLYVDEPRPGFLYHMWTEAYLDGHWIGFDATLGQGGIGPGHLKLTDSTLEAASAYSCFLPVADVQGRLKIKLLEAE